MVIRSRIFSRRFEDVLHEDIPIQWQPEQELIEGMERIMAGIGKELGVKGWVVPS
jgi:hypothetical protein